MRSMTQALVAVGALDAEKARPEYDLLPEDELRVTLLSQRLVTETQFAEAIAMRLGLPFIDLGSQTPSPEAVASVPGMLCRRHQLIPVRRNGTRLTVGMVDPTDLTAIDDVASFAGLIVEPAVVTPAGLQLALARHVRADDEISELSSTIGQSSTSAQASLDESLGDDDASAPVVRFVNLLITQAITDRASDIHVEPGEHELTVRFRIDGVLHVVQRTDRSIQDGVISRLKIMSAIDIAERRRPQDGRLTVQHEGHQVDLRVATLPTVWGEKITMRILDTSAQRMQLDDLDLAPENRERLEAVLARPYGMILVTGPTGSGKSTSLYASLARIAVPAINVVTVEDPVEYRIPGINQVQVNPKAGLTFASALRAILRIDPDVILVGEIRDRETAGTSIDAALTGHLVLSTLHTNDAPSALTRLVELGIEPYLVGSALTAVVGQRLTRRLCVRCRQPIGDAAERLAALHVAFDPQHPPTVYRAVGCAACADTGYRGRIALHELMLVSEQIEHELLHGTSTTKLRELATAEGMIPLRADGWRKVMHGLTTVEEVLRVSSV